MNKRVLEHLISTDLDFQCESARLMVIDDDAIVTRFVALCLKNAGFENVCCLSGAENALDRIRHYQPDLILLDIDMPGMDGLELLTLIRSHEEFRDILVMMLSGAGKASKYHSLNLGAVDFIDKPISPDEIGKRVRKVLRVV